MYSMKLSTYLLLFLGCRAMAQSPVQIQNVRFGPPKLSVTSYEIYNGHRIGCKSVDMNYEELSSSRALVCETRGCKVAGFSFNALPTGGYLLGPFKSTTDSLSPNALISIRRLIVQRPAKTKIVIESIVVNCNGVNQPVSGALICNIK